MRTAPKLAAYGVGLLVVFVASFGIGRAWGPTPEDQPTPTTATTVVHSPAGHDEEGSP